MATPSFFLPFGFYQEDPAYMLHASDRQREREIPARGILYDASWIYCYMEQWFEECESSRKRYMNRIDQAALTYQQEGQGASSLSEQDYIRYEVKVHDRVLQLGDEAQFKGHRLNDFEIRTEMQQGLLIHHYVLGHIKSAYQRKRYNSRLVGASISGHIMGVVRDEVKVQLDCDQEWSLATANLFPYSTMYASDDQTGWYCMPEQGDSIRLYFPNAREAEGIALSSVRKKIPEEAMASPSSSPASAQTTQTRGGGTKQAVKPSE
ncbi:hypothetical protein [Paenibacillus sp. 37]|uniref:hypothetical protein n=1 Tax=Paenibacillus sp. 37 TaxID=2607911 RepID=UPI00122DFFCD|nr:hypothetical protein [Paenibacillus sp. 37]